MKDLVALGSATAKSGFQNERDMCKKFENWKQDKEARHWLQEMGYELDKVSHVSAKNISRGYKTDIQIIINIDFKEHTENLSLKRTKSNANFNQIDKRWVKSYHKMWGFNDEVDKGLKLFTGETSPLTLLKDNVISDELYGSLKDKRRFYLHEMPNQFGQEILTFFKENKKMIISDVLKGRDKLAADWMLVTRYDLENDTVDWVLRDIDSALEIFGAGDVKSSSRGGLNIGRITAQRKGGDGGRPTANMLQFKASPLDLFRF